jgi:predicted class III extradiol MEMO1 family dioxygenase
MCRTDTDFEPLFPRNRWIISIVEMITEGPLGHVIIDEDHLAAIVAVANQRDKIEMTELGEHLDLGLELVGSLL